MLPYLTTREHGTRGRYVQGCRCAECRAENAAYARQREKMLRVGYPSNRITSAADVRRHLARLAAAGIGQHTIARICGIRRSTLQAIKNGRKRNVREQTARAILGVQPSRENFAGAALIDAGPTWRLVEQLLREGFTRTRIASELGMKGKPPALQLGRDRVTMRNARAVEKLWRRYMTEAGI